MNFDEKVPWMPSNWNNDRLHFFKYVSFETASIILKNRTLRWTTPRTLNDLYDVQFDLSIKVDFDRLEVLAFDKMWDVVSGAVTPKEESFSGQVLAKIGKQGKYESKDSFIRDHENLVRQCYDGMLSRLPKTSDAFREASQDLKLLCLTEDPTNPPMWAHYAGQDTGVVLRLRSIPFLDSPYGMARPMNYVQELPPLFDEEYISNVLAGIRDDAYRNKVLSRLTHSKGLAWSYEKEWRITSGDGRDKTAPYEDIPFGKNELDGIILGINMTAENRRLIVDLTKSYPNVEIFEAKRSNSGFQHEIAPFTD